MSLIYTIYDHSISSIINHFVNLGKSFKYIGKIKDYTFQHFKFLFQMCIECIIMNQKNCQSRILCLLFDHILTFPNCGAPCYAFDLELIPLESPWQGCVHSGHFINFQSTKKRLLNLKWFYHWKLIKIYKIKIFNAKPLHHSYIWGHICFFISYFSLVT